MKALRKSRYNIYDVNDIFIATNLYYIVLICK